MFTHPKLRDRQSRLIPQKAGKDGGTPIAEIEHGCQATRIKVSLHQGKTCKESPHPHPTYKGSKRINI